MSRRLRRRLRRQVYPRYKATKRRLRKRNRVPRHASMLRQRKWREGGLGLGVLEGIRRTGPDRTGRTTTIMEDQHQVLLEEEEEAEEEEEVERDSETETEKLLMESGEEQSCTIKEEDQEDQEED